jgi:hypothetical protein
MRPLFTRRWFTIWWGWQWGKRVGAIDLGLVSIYTIPLER